MEFTNDDYETPDWLAKAMCNLVKPTDRQILDPFAGTGQIFKYLPTSDRLITCIEIKRSRFGKIPNLTFGINDSFFNKFITDSIGEYDLIITNPPFSLCVEAIAHALTLLNSDNPESRLLFLMPLDWNCAQSRAKEWNKLDAHIHHVYRIAKRVDYLKEGVPMSQCQKIKNGIPQFNGNGEPIFNSGRQCYDAVFDIRPGSQNPSTTFLI